MKKLVVLLLTGILLTAFATNRKMPAVPIITKELKGYQLKDNNFSLNDYNLWVITHEQAFDKMFVAEDMSVQRPVFTNEIVMAVKVETVTNSYRVQFARIVESGRELNVYFNIHRDKVKNEISRPVTMIATERNTEIMKVNFFHGNVLIRSVPIVAVY